MPRARGTGPHIDATASPQSRGAVRRRATVASYFPTGALVVATDAQAGATADALRERLALMLLGEGKQVKASNIGRCATTATTALLTAARDAVSSFWCRHESEVRGGVSNPKTSTSL